VRAKAAPGAKKSRVPLPQSKTAGQVDVGSVNVRGGQQQASITPSIPARTPPEPEARRQFDSYKINAYVRETPPGSWLTGRAATAEFSGEFTVNVPRDMEGVKVETQAAALTSQPFRRVDAQSGGQQSTVDDIGGIVNAEPARLD